MNKINCKVCGLEFIPEAKNRYTAKEKVQGTLFDYVKIKMYDAFDCPQCGCQNLVGIRCKEVKENKESGEGNEKAN